MRRFFLSALLLGSVLLTGVFGQASSSDDAALEGTLSVEMYGAGAAPFGIASTILGGMSTAYNLGQLQQLDFEPRDLFGADETYFGDLDFTLRPKSSTRWELDELEFRYAFSDQTRLDYDEQARMWDSMGDAGNIGWANGQWTGPSGWNPGFKPRMDLHLFRAPTAQDCEDPEALGLWRYAQEILFDTSSWVSCYELEILVAHPMRPTGNSRWESPIGAVVIDAADGTLHFRAEGGALDPRDLPMPSGAPPEAIESMKRIQQLYSAIEQLLQSGLPTLGPDLDMTWDRTFRGPVRGRVAEHDVYPILTGATVIEKLDVPIIDLVLQKTDPLWEPRDDDSGTPVEVRVRSRSSASQPIPIRIRLSEVSRERGECLNGRRSDKTLDLWIDGSENSGQFEAPEMKKDGWLIETSKAVTEATLKVRSWDFGPWAKVQAQGKFGSHWITLEVEDSDKAYTTIPLDEEGGENHIWDHWETSHDLPPGSDPLLDSDDEPLSAIPGDGLALFEEYRGLLVDGEHTRLIPKVKDLFIHFADGSGLDRFRDDIQEATGLRVHAIRQDEFINPGVRIVNPNRGSYSVTDQHGLYVASWFPDGDVMDDGTAGQVECKGETPGRPKDCDMALIASHDADTVVHEVLHSIDVVHHGNLERREDLCLVGAKVFDETNERACQARGGGLEKAWIARTQGQHSGDQKCVMAYDIARGYRDTNDRLVKEADGRLKSFEMPGIDASHICNDSAGTDFNAGGKQAGDANFGVCRTQIWVSDQ